MLVQERARIEDFNCLVGFVVVRRDSQNLDEATDAGIIKPQTAQDKPQWCTVIATSESEMELIPGDRVFISKYPPGEIEPFPGERVLVIHKTLVYLCPKRSRQ